jgi:hypothetical protein
MGSELSLCRQLPHAISGQSSQQERRGSLSAADKAKVDRKADAVLGKKERLRHETSPNRGIDEADNSLPAPGAPHPTGDMR